MAQRLRLVKVAVDHNAKNNKIEISVELKLGRLDFVGHCTINKEELMLQAIAMATFDAVNQAMINIAGASFQIRLEAVEKLIPEFLDYPLIVVIVILKVKSEQVRVIGAVLAEDESLYHATAAAALDAINRKAELFLGT